MSPPRKDPIQNKYSTIIITQKYPILTPLLENWPTLYKPFFNDTHFSNKTEEEHNFSTDNSRTENNYSVNNLNVKKDEDKDTEYKEDDSEAPKSDKIVIKKLNNQKNISLDTNGFSN